MKPSTQLPSQDPKEPQQNIFTFGNVVFSSKFDSGNLRNVIKVDDQNVNKVEINSTIFI